MCYNYEYSYGQAWTYDENWVISWNTMDNQAGWGVKVIDNTQTDYVSPLTTIQGKPVTNMSYLFLESPATTLNLIDWDTSNVTDMYSMFYESQATSLDLSSFDTSNVTDMSYMFRSIQVKNLTARTQNDADKYQASSEFPTGVTVTVKA